MALAKGLGGGVPVGACLARGRAAGNFGDLYDNRDGDHSSLWRAAYPQLGFVEYDDAAQAAALHYGLNTRILFDAPTFGNSSTAIGQGLFWRSQARAALTTPGAARGVYNIGTGRGLTLNRLIAAIRAQVTRPVSVVHDPPRVGDVRVSLADVSAARAALGWAPQADFDAALAQVIAWFATGEGA